MTEIIDFQSASDIPAATDVYEVQPRPVWEAARADYLRGESSTEICRRYGLARSTFHARAAREGWRRRDQPPRMVGPYIQLTGDLDEASFFDLSEMASLRLRQAIMSGNFQEAAGWLAMVRQLRDESAEHDPPLEWFDDPDPVDEPLDSLDALDRSSGVQLSPRTRPDPETPAPPASSPDPGPGSDAGSGQSAR